eukprot:gb/GEZN01006450.1/.p1 GENE.gb/GEZN01006450.1/~~gb/GEZN01006450.1/.p1  ORF type:complete len:448 (-),score=130.43 gb/GEZN01006450.1/:283-1626(-)
MAALPTMSAKAAKKRLPTSEKKDEMTVYMADLEYERSKSQRPKQIIYRPGKAPEWAGAEDSDDEDLLSARTRRGRKVEAPEMGTLSSDFQRRAAVTAEVIVGDKAVPKHEVKPEVEFFEKQKEGPPKFIDVTQLEVPEAEDAAEQEDAVLDRRARARARAKAKREEADAAAAAVEEAKEEEDEEEDDESESESGEEFVALSRPMLKPTFVSKDARVTIAERERLEAEEIAVEEAKEIAKEERKTQTKKLVETLKMEDELKLSKLGEGSDDELPGTDDEDDDALLASWKIRELTRIKRDKEERDAFEKESKEIERRRNMTDAEIAEENARIGKGKGEDRGQMRFLQKYYHPGAFYQGAYDEVQARDFMEPTGEDRTVDRTLLPKVLQVKKFGLKGRTKYTHLMDQDTTRKDDNIFLASEKEAGTISRVKLAGTGSLDTAIRKKRRTGD